MINIFDKLFPSYGGKVITDSKYIKDAVKNKNLEDVVKDIDNELARQQGEISALHSGNYVTVTAEGGDTSVEDIMTREGITPAVDTIYRIGAWDGTQYDDTAYSEYSWNQDDGYKFIAAHKEKGIDAVPTAGSHNLVESSGVQNELALGAVYDVSAKNPTSGPNNDGKWESLSALLSDTNLNTLIPTSVRKGGMSIKFIQSSDNNKYVQYRLMSDTFSITESDWQGVDDEPTAGSDNLVKSGGVFDKIQKLNTDNLAAIDLGNGVGSFVFFANDSQYFNSIDIPVNEGDSFVICGYGGGAYRLWGILDEDRRIVRVSDANVDTRSNPITLTIGKGEKYLICNFNVSYTGWAARNNISDSVNSSSNETNKFSFKKEVKSENISSGSSLRLSEQYLRRNCVLSCAAIGTTPYITLGRGTKTTAYAYWAEIDSTNIVIKAYIQGATVTITTLTHGLTISGYLSVSIISKDTTAKIVAESQSGVYESEEFAWCGGGAPFVENDSSDSLSCTISFYATGMNGNVLLIQDSYGIYWNSNTAAYHLLKENINGWQINCQTGINSTLMRDSFVNSLLFGKPMYAVWCIGMNDSADSNNQTPDSTWLSKTSAFIKSCKSLNIIPVLGTIPSIPSKLHEGKNDWIRNNSGCRYIDFAAAVGSQADGTWYDGMLGNDAVHPSDLGGKALMTRLMSDLPEIINRQYVTKNDIDSAKSEIKTVIDNYSNVINASNLSKTSFTGIVAAATYIKDNYPELKKRGALMTFFKDSDSRWMTYQFNDVSTTIITDTDWINYYKWKLVNKSTTVYVDPSEGIGGINDRLWSNPDGIIIELGEGTYTGSVAIQFYNGGAAKCKNCVIIGKGVKTVINRTSGNDVIQNSADNDNNIIMDVALAHGYSRQSPRRLRIYRCLSNGAYTDDSLKSVYDIKIAANDSSEYAKNGADFICSGSDDQTVINSAITAISSTGGTIFLSGGTYNLSAYIDLRGKSNISIKGSGKNTVLNRPGAYAIFGDNTTSDCCVSELSANGVNLPNGVYQYNVWINNRYIVSSPNENRTTRVLPEQGIAGINDAINAMPESGGTIELSSGTYTGNTFISFYKSSSPAGYKNNIRIVGRGKSTVIQRDTNAFDLVANSTDVKGNIIENVSFAHSINRVGGSCPTEQVRLIACYINGNYVDESNEGSSNIINIGADRYYKTISSVLELFHLNGINSKKRWELHVYGHIVETSYFGITKNYIDIIGHNAIVEIRGGKNEFIRFLDDDSNDFYGPGLYITVKDIHFLKTGCYSYWDSPCVVVESNCVTFENCTFENQTSNPYPYNQSDYGVGYEDMNGGRRHGIEVYCSKYDIDCKTTFKNCVAIGSPYGTNSSRGWYLIFGSPKLFNCIGYGGGYGEFGHGILNHRSSRAELYDCIGYAGANSYRQAAGIRFQACGSSQLTGCTGVPSYGVKRISNGVTASAISRICTELELDESTYVVDGVVQFAAVAANLDICAKITNDDIDIVDLNEGTEESYGFSFWANSGIARLNSCKGYIGSGENSRALHCIANSEPTIIGGYYGLEDIISNTYYTPNQGQNYMTFIPVKNEYVPYKIRKVAVTVVGYSPANGDKLYLETVESTPQVIVDGFDMSGLSSIVNPIFNEVVVPAGVKLKAYVMNSGVIKQITSGTMIYHIASNYKPLNSSALYIADNSTPIIKGAILRSNNDAISVGQGVDNIKVFDCLCEGTVDSGITFASKTAINGSSNYSI